MCMKVQKVFVVYDLKLSFYREQGLLMRYIHIKKKIIILAETTTLKGTVHPTIKTHSLFYSPLLKIK